MLCRWISERRINCFLHLDYTTDSFLPLQNLVWNHCSDSWDFQGGCMTVPLNALENLSLNTNDNQLIWSEKKMYFTRYVGANYAL